MGILIQVSEEFWKELKNRKVRPSQTFEDIILEMINEGPKSLNKETARKDN